MKKFTVLFVVLLAVIVTAVIGYSSIRVREEAVLAEWGNVEAAYRQRSELVPGLVEVISKYAKYEVGTLNGVTDAHKAVKSLKISKEILDQPEAFAKLQEIQEELSGMVTRLILVAERHIDLTADQRFLALKKQVEDSERRITDAQARYNTAAEEFNRNIEVFPASMATLILKQGPKPLFQAHEEPKEPETPRIKF